ncbi:hypothetical protein ACA910_016726 [Epithemia clementina (nom. ined.)]
MDQVEQLWTGPGSAVIPPSAVPAPPAPVPYQMKHLEGKINTILVKFKHFWATITGTIHGELQAIFQQHLYNSTSRFQTNLAQPTLHFLQTWAMSPATPGNKLEAALYQIESSVQSIKCDVSKLKAIAKQVATGGLKVPTGPTPHTTAPLPAPFGWGTHVAFPTFGTPLSSAGGGGTTVGPDFESKVNERLQALEESVNQI